MKKIIQKPSQNYSNLIEKPYIIIIHTTLGSYEGAVEWLRISPDDRLKRFGKKSYSSAHFVIGRSGETSQLVSLGKAAWHAGSIDKPTKRAKEVCRRNIFGKIKNPNTYSIGIELASGYDIDRDGLLENWEKAYTVEQIKQCVELILYIENKLNIKIYYENILTHKDINSYKPDLEKQRDMILLELKSKRNKENKIITLEDGDKLTGYVDNGIILLKKK